MSILCLSTAALSHRQPEAGGSTGVTCHNLRDQGHDKRDTLCKSRNTKTLAAVLHQTKIISVYDQYLRLVSELVTSNHQSKVAVFFFIESIPLCDNISILYIPVLHKNLH